MKCDEFRDYLTQFPYSSEQVAECMLGVELFEQHLSELPDPAPIERAAPETASPFVDWLDARGGTRRQRLIGVYFYTGMVANYPLHLEFLAMLDGFEIIGNLYRSIGEELGTEAQRVIFADVDLPEIGTVPNDWMRVNAIVFPRLEALADPDTVKRILRSGLRNLPDASYLPIKERYEQMPDLDAFLEDRRDTHFATLRGHRDDGTPYFNQLINDEVLEFVAAHPEIGGGVRDGNTIYETKIPHQAIEYLAATDLQEAQYRVCHCPLVKDSILDPDTEISPAFCEFCPSFNAKPWEIIFEQKLDYDVLESAQRGGKWCRFAIHLPESAGSHN